MPSSSVRYRNIDILGHGPRTCPVCTQCLRLFHPDALHSGRLATSENRGEAWLCGDACLYAWRRGLPRDWSPSPAKASEPPAAAPADLLAKYRPIPGASWADEAAE